MKKSYIVDSTCNDMRLDRWLRLKIGKIPQGLVEKYLRTGKIKLNRKKVKSSFKVKTKDEINIFNIEFKETIQQKKIKFLPSKEIIKSNEDQIIDNNDNFIVLNKASGISVQGGTKSKKNLVDIFAKSEIFEGTKPYSVHRLDKDNIGIWHKYNNEVKKIAAIGIRVSKWIAYHGFAININNDLENYKKIIPCGISDKGVTNLKNILDQDYSNLNDILIKNFISNLKI